jgi:MFS family permease
LSAAFGTGFIIGPALGGVVVRIAQMIPALAPYSQVAPFFVAAVFSLGSVVATYILLPESLPEKDRNPLGQRRADDGETRLVDLLAISGVRLILIFAGIAFLAFAIFQSSFPLVASRNVLSDLPLEDVQFSIALLLTWIGFLNVVVQFSLVGPLVKQFGERQLVVAGTLLRIPAFVGIALARTPLAIALSFVPLALGNSISFPVLQSLISRYAPPTMRGQVLGVFQSTQSLMLVIGPAIAGPLLTVGTSVPPWVAAALIGVSFLVSIQILSLPLPTQEATAPEAAVAPAH